MSDTFAAFARAALIATALSVALSACGRRGALQPPPDPSAPQQSSTREGSSDVDDTDESSGALAPVTTTGAKKRGRDFTIPKEPFVLDPLL